MEKPIEDYHSIHDLFTRNLRGGLRQADQRIDTVTSPVDGVIHAFGKISGQQTLYIKEQLYKLDELLGSKEVASFYKNGQYAVIYLSPSHYHRIHYHACGSVVRRWALGEKSYPVNRFGEKYGDKPFSTNYRVISEITTDSGRTAIIKVGALNINSICLTNSNTVVTKGEEIGYFSFGSTVILLFDGNSGFTPEMKFMQDIKMGQTIGRQNH